MKAFISLNETNKENFKYPPHINVDANGVPICMAGHAMISWGYNPDRCRIKYDCPLTLGKIDSCDCKELCSPSAYGRCIYIKPAWDLRLFTIIPRGSDEWKIQWIAVLPQKESTNISWMIMDLNYPIPEKKKRTFWWSLINSLNVLVDARLKVSGFSFADMLAEKLQQVA